jgi:uncharacterized membrane protein YoaK (UPF0700 family)
MPPPPDHPADGRLMAALALLTLLTGLVDAASVLGLGHVFTANMTGNVVFLGFSLVGAGRVATSDCLVALAAFLGGAVVAGRMATKGVRLAVALGLEAALIAAAAVVAAAAPSPVATIALLAFAMGVQNASVRKLGVLDMTTTVLTLTLTGLAADSSLAGGASPRVARRLTSIVVMLVGAVAGALLLRRGVAWTIGAAALIAASACAVA